MAQVTVRDLMNSPGVDSVGIADLNFDAAKRFADQFADERAQAAKADIRDIEGLRKLISEYDVLVNSTWYQFNLQVMQAAIDVGIHYLDLGGLYHMTLKQLELDRKAKDADVSCVLGIGSTPGTMNVMAAYGGNKMTRIEKVKLRSGSAVVTKSSDIFQSPYSIRTVLDEFSLPAIILRDGEIQEVPALSGKESFVLPDPVGELEGYYTLHSELATLPENLGKSVREMDFIVAYPSEFTKTITLLVRMGLASRQQISVKGAEVAPYDVLATTVDSLPKAEAELDVDVQRVELYGEADSKPLKLRYDSVSVPNEKWNIGGGTVGTGTPPSITAQWLASGRVKVRGTVPPESCIDPLPFFKELAPRGIRIYEYSEETASLF